MRFSWRVESKLLVRAVFLLFLTLSPNYAQTNSAHFIFREPQAINFTQQRVTPQNPSNPLIWIWESEPRWLSGVDWGGQVFFGSIAYGSNFFGSTLSDEQFVDVEIRFNSAETTFCQTYRRDLGYPAAGVGVFLGSIWDISDPLQPRRLNACFAEDSAIKPADHFWNPDSSSLGAREYLFIMYSDYDSTGLTYNDTLWGPAADVIYGFWPKLEPNHTFLETDPSSLSIMQDRFFPFYSLADNQKIFLGWNYTGLSADHFKLFGALGTAPLMLLDSLPPDAEEYVHPNLVNDSTYRYQIRSYDQNGNVLHYSPLITDSPGIVSEHLQLMKYWHKDRQYFDLWGYRDTNTGKDYALLVSGFNNFFILDLSQSPVRTAFSDTNDTLDVIFEPDVKTYDHYAFVARLLPAGKKVQVFDLADPYSPVLVNEIDGDGPIDISSHFLYIKNPAGSSLQFYDVQNAASPQLVGSWNAAQYEKFVVQNDLIFAANGDLATPIIDIINVADKSAPFLAAQISSFDLEVVGIDVSEDGNYLFITGRDQSQVSQVKVFNISDLQNPFYLTNYVISGQEYIGEGIVKGEYFYVAHFTAGLHVLDFSDPSSLQDVAYYDLYPELTPNSPLGTVEAYPVPGFNQVYIIDRYSGLQILELDTTITGIPEQLTRPETFYLSQNYPNPFNPSTTIGFQIPQQSRSEFVELTIFNSLGEVVKTLASGKMNPGFHVYTWDGTGNAGEAVASGVYFYRLRAGKYSAVRKMLLLR